MRIFRFLALAFAIGASLGSACDEESPTDVPNLASITGLYVLTATRIDASAGCPAAITSPRTVAAATNASNQITLPLLIGNGTLASDIDPFGEWDAEGDATLANGILVRQHLFLGWDEDQTGRPRAEGNLTVEHIAPDGRILCTEEYDVTLVWSAV